MVLASFITGTFVVVGVSAFWLLRGREVDQLAARTAFSLCLWTTTVSFLYAILFFLTSIVGLGASIWPEIVPGSLDIWQASSEHRTQMITITVLAVFVPIILAYVGVSYWAFRGKIRDPVEPINQSPHL